MDFDDEEWKDFLDEPLTLVPRGGKLGLAGFDSVANGASGRSYDTAIVDNLLTEKEETMVEASITVKAEWESMAMAINAYLSESEPARALTCTLIGPATLTVLVPTKGFRKDAHIGGEGFRLESVYLGKKNSLIGVFKLEAAATYQHMEMSLNKALTDLRGVDDILDAALAGGYKKEVARITQLSQDAMIAARAEEKSKDYDNFGTW